MTKIAICTQHGGYNLSQAAVERYAQLKGLTLYPEPGTYRGQITYWLVPPEQRVKELPGHWGSYPLAERRAYNKAYAKQVLSERDIARDDPALIQAIEQLGDKAAGRFCTLKIVEIPDDVDWKIEEYDGAEWVAEKHRTWS